MENTYIGRVRVICLRSIHEVDESHWDSINSDQDLFHTHRFIRSIEDARVENCRFWYLLFYHKDQLIATAVLSSFTISLDLFVGSALKRVIGGIRRWFQRFLKIKILFCGLPVSLGQRNLVISDPLHFNEVFYLLDQEMATISHSNGIRFMCAKEFCPSDYRMADGLSKYGFFQANSLPYVSLDIRWPDFAHYLADLRHPYRRTIMRSLKKLDLQQPEINSDESELSDRPRLIVGGAKACSPAQFFRHYIQVMDRAVVKLETLNQLFFENIYMRADLEVLTMKKGADVLGSAILMIHKDVITFMLVGLDYSRRDEFDVYFNLVYGIISLAIQRGCTRLNLGQTSYWLKQRIGGNCTPEFFYLKAKTWYVNFCLRALRSWIFPEKILPNPRVFREYFPGSPKNISRSSYPETINNLGG
jgi:predicted N-acyltransferase